MKLYIIKWFSFYLGCVGCYLLQRQWGWSAVFSSALLGFTFSFIPLPQFVSKKGVQSAFYAGTFAGMSSPAILANHNHVLLISVIGAATYFLMKPYWIGVGGKMGVVAFISTLIFLLIRVFG